MVASLRAAALLTGLAAVHGVVAAESSFKIETRDDIIATSRTLAQDLVTFYEGNKTGKTPGIFPGPPVNGQGDYYWDYAAHIWATLIEYWHVTGDETYNDIIIQGMQWQSGPNKDYLPPNQTATMGNFEQCSWALAALGAAERGFPNPPADGTPWLKLAQNVFDTQASRYADEVDKGTCDGGLRWQIPPTNIGYNYKDSFSNACFFSLAARLARFTGNTTYSASATATYDWLTKIGFIDSSFNIYDGAHVEHNCTDINKLQLSHTASAVTLGAANLYNLTSSDEWKNRVSSLANATLSHFFPKGIAYEPSCELEEGFCSTDMVGFKGHAHRWLAATTQVAPFLAGEILPVLKTSAQAAVKQCTGGKNGRACGFYWSKGEYVQPKTTGALETMDVLAAVDGLLVGEGKGLAKPVGGGAGGVGDDKTKPSGAVRSEVGIGMLVAGVVGLGMAFLS